jgi:diketogulonate reductase-like aldo/keto reductase
LLLDRKLLGEQVFTELASKYKKSNAQIILRWNIQMGNIVIPGSRNEAHIGENLDLFDFTLTKDELHEIARINQNKPYYTANM